MKQNILLVGYNYELSKRIAEKVAVAFAMRVFDQLELFAFDHMPRTFGEVCKSNGTEYVKRTLKSIIKMETGFEDAVFVADLVMADNCSDIYHQIKMNNFVVLLHKKTNMELEELKKKKYPTQEETDFFAYNEKLLMERKMSIAKDCADISIDMTDLSEDEIVQAIVNNIRSFYKI